LQVIKKMKERLGNSSLFLYIYDYMKKADNFDAKQWLVENKITFQSRLNEEENSKFDDNAKAYGILFTKNKNKKEIEETPYVWNNKAITALVKSMGYTNPNTVAGEFTNYTSPGDEDEMDILRKQEENPELQPEDITIGMYKKSIEKEFPEKEDNEDYDEQAREKSNPKLKKLIEKNKDLLIDKFRLDKSSVEVIDYTYYDYVGIANPFGGDKAVHFSETPINDGDESGEIKIEGKTIYYTIYN